jgi:hypothetical protein
VVIRRLRPPSGFFYSPVLFTSVVMADLDPTALSQLYRWIDTIPLDRPKRNIARDFSDGVLMSQVVHYFFPKLVSERIPLLHELDEEACASCRDSSCLEPTEHSWC